MDDFTKRMLNSSSGSKSGPPPLPVIDADGTAPSSFHHQAATYAVLALPACIILNIVLGSVVRSAADAFSPTARLVLSAIPGLVMLTALPAGIIALCGIPKHGKKKLLWKGLVGVIVPILLLALAIPAFLAVKKMSEKKARQQQESR